MNNKDKIEIEETMFGHLFQKRFFKVLGLVAIALIIIIVNQYEKIQAIAYAMKFFMSGFMIYVAYSYKSTIGKRIGMFFLASLVYTLIIASFSGVFVGGFQLVKNYFAVEKYIDGLKAKIDAQPITNNGITLFKIDKIDKKTIRESIKFNNLSKTEILDENQDLEQAKKDVEVYVKQVVCTDSFKALLNAGMVYYKDQFDKDMQPTTSITIKGDCDVSVVYHTDKK